MLDLSFFLFLSVKVFIFLPSSYFLLRQAFQLLNARSKGSSNLGASKIRSSKINLKATFSDDLVIDIFPLETHSLEQLLRILQIDLLSPRNDKDQPQNSIIKIIYFKGLDDEFSFEVFTIDDTIDKTEDDGFIEFDNSGEKKKPSCGDNCSKLQHLRMGN